MDSSHLTVMLQEASGGSREAADRLLPVVYDELRRLAQSHMEREGSGHTLQATVLVHEAYLKLIDQTRVNWQNRSHFFAVAAKAMRRILIDHARRRNRHKRGGGAAKLSLDEALAVAVDSEDPALIDLDEALERLAALHPLKEQVVELRFFGGLTGEETAHVLGVDRRTVDRHWQFARAWLFRELTGKGGYA
jgi:RNA polymerase sigma factor (TIGR02999 family)